jgi:chromosome segregation ATPase
VSTTLPIRPEELRNYVKTYEEQSKLQRERESLEAQARKGKIPRRLYRVRSRTLESRLSLLSKDLATLRNKIRSAGARYSDMMRQIEVAQTELLAVEADIRRTEARYRRGEISAVTYHKLLEDYLKRKDRAQTSIDGILLRLREE